MTTNTSIVVAAIDFGTTYSGYAYSWQHDYVNNPLMIYTNTEWIESASNLLSHKTSTSILFDKDGKFDSFGFEADTKYLELAEDDKHEDWRYFRRFKLQLQREQRLRRNLNLEDDQGRPMKALYVFGESIRYLKDHLFDRLKEKDNRILEKDIYWVLTVPAIWSDEAKQFMKEAAEYAGIDPERLSLVLEPEAASVYCKETESATGESECPQTFIPGFQYMLVDLGGGTADVTVHEIQSNGSLREIVPPSGGPMGGDLVNLAFEKFINDLFHPDVMEKLKKDHKSEHFGFLSAFEIKKRENLRDEVRIQFPSVMSTLFRKKKKQTEEQYVNNSEPTIRKDKIILQRDVFLSFFSEVKEKVVSHLQDLCAKDELKRVKTLVIVGGFSGSKIMTSAIREAFPDYTVMIPEGAGLAVLKGAVLLGRNPAAITSRRMRFTYGVSTAVPFDHSKHSPVHLSTKYGNPFCEDVFKVVVKKGTEMACNKGIEHIFSASAAKPVIEVYRSTNYDPKYINDKDCTLVGSVEVVLDREPTSLIKVTFLFGQTMLKVVAEEESTRQKVEADFNLLAGR